MAAAGPERLRTCLGAAMLLAACAGGGEGSTPTMAPPVVTTAPAPPPEVATYVEDLRADRLDSPTALAVTPDGRVFVAGQGGTVRVVAVDGLLPEPLLTVDTEANNEEGLTAVALDPDFAATGFVYVTYTARSPEHHQRVSRFTIAGNIADPGSEHVVVELGPNRVPYHLGGALAFADDATLLVTTGEGVGANPQSDRDLAGKVLRVDPGGGTDPSTAIVAKGFRAPWAMAVDPATGTAYVSDLGENAFEEVDELVDGGNYGWPVSEGLTTNPDEETPIMAYGRSEGCAIVGGAFAEGRYLFMDYCLGWIRALHPATGDVREIGHVTGTGPVAIAVGGNGDIHYLVRGSTSLSGGTGPGFDTGALYRLRPAPG